MASTKLRKTRFVCISDTHKASPLDGAFKLPKGDVLIHAGDLSNQGSLSELVKSLEWIEKADFEVKIVVAGNHDITLDKHFYDDYGLYFHNQNPQNAEECRRLFLESETIIYLNHESATIRLQDPNGPQTTFKAFGSPYSPARGLWAFGYLPDNAPELWDKIPLDTDIVITHTPPMYHCDESKDRGAAGCTALRQALWRVRPSLSICGHVHEGRGMQRVRWDLNSTHVKYKEEVIDVWEDPSAGTLKQCKIDLTAKGGKPLANDRSIGDRISPPDTINFLPTTLRKSIFDAWSVAEGTKSSHRDHNPIISSSSSASTVKVQSTGKNSSDHQRYPYIFSHGHAHPSIRFASRGIGGISLTELVDLEALSDRKGRQETCVVNAAIMASSWPHQTRGGRKFNKPIVVDIDLPVWESDKTDPDVERP
ncbi:MAG: hypothetical protein M1834_009658 [Cirrosporium novae-zelandiae]|nr:MAG: hypothetical protein M1834_009658 [Cirrosporium novae-zelandiae]